MQPHTRHLQQTKHQQQVFEFAKNMSKNEGLRIEPLGRHPELCVLRDHRDRELGTGLREVLEVLLFIIEKCGKANERVARPLARTKTAAR